MALYPPLASLETLPNLFLAHLAIQLELRGPCMTCAGHEEAGLVAVYEAIAALEEGRCDVALAGATSSSVDATAARDLVRLGEAGPSTPPGEASVVLLLRRDDLPGPRVGRGRRWLGASPSAPRGWQARLGIVGPVTGLVDLVAALREPGRREVEAIGRGGAGVSLWAEG